MSRGIDLVQGELITLAASAARTADGNGDWVYVGGERDHFTFVLDITNSDTDAGDTLDVYIDGSFDGSTQAFNIAHFPQQAGNAAAARVAAAIGSNNPGTATFVVTADIAAGGVRSALRAPYLRARWVIVDSGDANSSHTFSVVGWAE